MVLEINSKDYNNLRTDYSDQNIISRLQGTEFLIDDTSVVSFDVIATSNINQDGVITPTYPAPSLNPIQGLQKRTAKITNPLFGIVSACRAELYYGTYSFNAEIEEVIYDKNNISIDYEIDYDTYKYDNGNVVNGSIYNSQASPYIWYMNDTYLVNKSNGNRYPQILTNEYFDMPKAECQYLFTYIDNYFTNIDIYTKINNIIVNSVTGKTTLSISCKFPLWYAWNNYSGFFPKDDNFINRIRTIKLKINANTVNVTENTFDYGDFNEEPYSLESNEFLQYQNGESVEDRVSYNISQEIFEKAERNRMLVSFNLFRLDKLDWDENDNLRFIRSRDRIKIKDELGNYLGAYYDDSGNEIIPEFEVVRANGKWDGKFYKEIIAKQVYIED